MATYFLGIDGGGSGTRAVIINREREVIGSGEAGPSNHYSNGPLTAARNCAAAASQAVSEARSKLPDFEPDQIVTWGFGLAGVGRESDWRLMHSILTEICSKPFTLDTDVAAAHAGAFNGKAGIVVSGGTGAITLGIDEAGEKYVVDGWGPILGDEGGGYWIGVQALRAVARSLDGRAGATPLVGSVFEALGVKEKAELVPYVYSEDCSRDQIAALAQVVFRLADGGVPQADAICQQAVQALTESIKAVACQMLRREKEPIELAVALRGGLFHDGSFRENLGLAVAENLAVLQGEGMPLKAWQIIEPQYDATIGAAILGQLHS